MGRNYNVTVDQRERKVILKGVEYPFPEETSGSNISIDNEQVRIDDYLLQDGEWVLISKRKKRKSKDNRWLRWLRRRLQ